MMPAGVKPAAFGARFRGVDLAIALAPRDVDHRIVAATRAPQARRLHLRDALPRAARAAHAADRRRAERGRPGDRRAPSEPRRSRTRSIKCSRSRPPPGRRTLVHDLVLPVTDEDRAAVAEPAAERRSSSSSAGAGPSTARPPRAACSSFAICARSGGRSSRRTARTRARWASGSSAAGVADARARRLAVPRVGGGVRAGGVRGHDRHRCDPCRKRRAGADRRPVRAQVVSPGVAGMVAVPRAERDPAQTAGRIRGLAARIARRDRRRGRITCYDRTAHLRRRPDVQPPRHAPPRDPLAARAGSAPRRVRGRRRRLQLHRRHRRIPRRRRAGRPVRAPSARAVHGPRLGAQRRHRCRASAASCCSPTPTSSRRPTCSRATSRTTTSRGRARSSGWKCR